MRSRPHPLMCSSSPGRALSSSLAGDLQSHRPRAAMLPPTDLQLAGLVMWPPAAGAEARVLAGKVTQAWGMQLRWREGR